MKQTITLKQYTTQRAAQRFCERWYTLVENRFKLKVGLVVNQIDSRVFQVELVGEFGKEIDLIFF